MEIENERRLFEDTVLFDDDDDTVVLDSPSIETQMEKLEFDAQVVGNLDSVEDDDRYVALDSEDEGLCKTKSTIATSEHCDTEGLSNRESIHEGNCNPQLPRCDQGMLRLNYVCSEEPGESSQSSALDFVDRFLSSNKSGFSPVTETRNTIRRKSSPVSSAKGAQSFAKCVEMRRKDGKFGIFEWHDGDQHGRVVDFCTKKMDASFDSGGCRKRSVLSYQSDDHAGNQERNKEVPVHSPSYIRAAFHYQTDTSRMEPVSEANIKKSSVEKPNQQLNAVLLEQEFEAGMFDVGFDTQMAAEVMESLSSATHACLHPSDAFQHPQNLLADSSKGLPRNKFHLGRSPLENEACTELKGFVELPKGRMFPEAKGTSGSPQKNFSHKELDDELAMITRKKRKNGRNWTHKNESSAKECSRSTMQFEEEEAEGRSNRKMYEDYESSLASLENISLGKQQAQGEVVSQQAVHCKIEQGFEDKLDAPRERTIELMKSSTITYRRRKRSCLGAEPFRPLSARREFAKSCFNTSKEVGNNRLGHQSKAILEVSPLISSMLCSFRWPKRRRTRRKLPTHLGGCTPYTPLNAVKGQQHHKRFFGKNLPRSCTVKELVRLGTTESKSNLMWKDLRKRREMAHVRVLFSQHLEDDIINKQKKILARLGMSTASCSRDATHFIADRFVRTSNMLEAIALGKPVVTHHWLQSCGEACCLIDEKNYILRDAKKEKEIGFNMAVSLARAAQRPLLKGRSVLITPKVKPDKEMITSLVKAVRGQIVEKNQLDAPQIPEDLLIISCEEDHPICVPFLEKGAAIYSSELLLNGIIIQKLEYERHWLFITGAKKNRSKKK